MMPALLYVIEFYSITSLLQSHIINFLLNIMYVGHTISFQTFFVWEFKIVVDSWKFTMLLLYIL